MSAIAKLKLQYAWPSTCPIARATDFGWDGGGRHLVTQLLERLRPKVILEIGSFLGLSTRQWLKAAPDAVVICVDPWEDTHADNVIAVDSNHYQSALVGQSALAGQSSFETFQVSNWEFRDRIIPVRGKSPGALKELSETGLQVDVIYVDGDHEHDAVIQDISICQQLFPRAIVTGDDWTWDKNTHPPHSVREAVEFVSARDGIGILAERNTWVLKCPQYARIMSRAVMARIVRKIRKVFSR